MCQSAIPPVGIDMSKPVCRILRAENIHCPPPAPPPGPFFHRRWTGVRGLNVPATSAAPLVLTVFTATLPDGLAQGRRKAGTSPPARPSSGAVMAPVCRFLSEEDNRVVEMGKPTADDRAHAPQTPISQLLRAHGLRFFFLKREFLVLMTDRAPPGGKTHLMLRPEVVAVARHLATEPA